MRRSRILGLGHYVPERVVTNDDLAALMDTNDAWIRERSGIRERRHITPGSITCSEMGARASRQALAAAGIEAGQVDLIIFATLSPDYFFPGNGVFLQELLGCDTVGALDVRNQCTGFVYGLAVADQFVRTGMHEHVLVVGAEIQSTGIEMADRGRDVAVLFGDGAGAAVVGPSDAPTAASSTPACTPRGGTPRSSGSRRPAPTSRTASIPPCSGTGAGIPRCAAAPSSSTR